MVNIKSGFKTTGNYPMKLYLKLFFSSAPTLKTTLKCIPFYSPATSCRHQSSIFLSPIEEGTTPVDFFIYWSFDNLLIEEEQFTEDEFLQKRNTYMTVFTEAYMTVFSHKMNTQDSSVVKKKVMIYLMKGTNYGWNISHHSTPNNTSLCESLNCISTVSSILSMKTKTIKLPLRVFSIINYHLSNI